MRERLGRNADRIVERELGGVREYLLKRRERARVELPEGAEVQNECGTCFVRAGDYAFDGVHGSIPIGGVRDVDWARIAELAKDDVFAETRLDECLFLDTETTGLAGGAGTTVFMIGLGFFHDAGFRLEQVFLRSFGDEPAALRHTAERLAEHPVLVTFVGKSFDRHRLASRMTLHRVEAPILDPRHLDLYYLSRRLWKDELPDVRLQTVERERLGVFRDDDLPGSEAPRAFIDWLRDGSGPIDRVFEHNRLDVLTLVTLLAKLGSDVD